MKQERIPSRRECLRLLEENGVYPNIIEHSKAVAEIALEYGRKIKANGGKLNIKLLEASALLHDICKHEGLGKDTNSEITHPETGARKLREMGLPDVADVVEVHGFGKIFEPQRLNTWEKKLVYYADKRVNHDKRVALSERLDYLTDRYPHGADMFRKARPMLLKLEKEIFEKAGVSE